MPKRQYIIINKENKNPITVEKILRDRSTTDISEKQTTKITKTKNENNIHHKSQSFVT